jgi:acetyl esterase
MRSSMHAFTESLTSSVSTTSWATRFDDGTDAQALRVTAATRAIEMCRRRRRVSTALKGYCQTGEMPLHVQARSLLDAIERLDQPPIETLDPVVARADRAALVRPSIIEGVVMRDLDAGGVLARLYRPAHLGDHVETGLMLWFHGGGWVLGSVDGHDDLCRVLALRSGHSVLSIEYRLAPEDPFPDGLTDAITSTRWAHEHATELGSDPARIGVAGDSAGANLAAVVAQLAPAPLRYQVLVYPVTDARRGSASYHEHAEGYFLTASGMAWFVEHYLAGHHGSEDDPRVSPLLASDEAFAASPPTLVVTAEFDPLRDEGVAYAQRLAAAGVTTSHVMFNGQIHGFISLPEFLDDAHAARALVAQAIATALDEETDDDNDDNDDNDDES